MEVQDVAEPSEIAPTLSMEDLVTREVAEQPVPNASEDQSHIMVDPEEQTSRQNLTWPAEDSPTSSDTEGSDSDFISIYKKKHNEPRQEVVEDNPVPLPPPPPPAPKKPLKFVKSTSFKNGSNSLIKQYRTRGPNRGLMVIFVYSKFLTRPDERDVERDCEMMKDLFNDCFRFKVIIHKDLDKAATLKMMETISVEGYESLFIVVSSHGCDREGQWDTHFDCHLGKIRTYDVVNMFNNSNRPELVDIPKVFIFQMCRGSKKLSESQAAKRDAAPQSADDESAANNERCVRMFSDVLVAHSTVPGFESYFKLSNSNDCSLYIEALCQVFASLAHEYHVLDLFRILDNRFKELCPSTITAVETWGFGDLYLHPGLVEDVDKRDG